VEVEKKKEDEVKNAQQEENLATPLLKENIDNYDSVQTQVEAQEEQIAPITQGDENVPTKIEAAKEDVKIEEPAVVSGGGEAESKESAPVAKEEEKLLEIDHVISMLKEKPTLKRISSKKVDQEWTRCRGAESPTPKTRNIEYAIKKSDTNKDGKLTPDEMKRLTGAFIQHGGDAELSNQELFDILDENADGELTFDEVSTTFKAMYLMKSDGVELNSLLHED